MQLINHVCMSSDYKSFYKHAIHVRDEFLKHPKLKTVYQFFM